MAVAAAVTLAQPSQALDFEANALTSRYIDHATAAMSAGDFASDRIEPASGTAADFAGPVEAHAEAAVATDLPSLPRLVDTHATARAADREQECLANAVYFESRGEPLEGQLAVAEVILNRARSDRYPSDLCAVIGQKAQFSFVQDGRIPAAPKATAAWRKSVAIARIAQRDLAESAGSDAMFFHATYVAPVWRHGMDKVGTIGRHVFYR